MSIALPETRIDAQHADWLALERAVTAFRALQQKDGAVRDDVDRDAASALLDDVRASVTALAPAMAGAFVALGGGETGFLPDKETAGPLPQDGQVLPVRVTRAAQGGKGPRVSARLTREEEALAAAAEPGDLWD